METYYLVAFECNNTQWYEITSDFSIASRYGFEILEKSTDEQYIYKLLEQHK